jgi:hypothetical protein
LKPAKEVIKKACSLLNDAPEILQLKNDLETEIDGIFEEIKKEWMQGNMHTTRKILNQYLNFTGRDKLSQKWSFKSEPLGREPRGDRISLPVRPPRIGNSSGV